MEHFKSYLEKTKEIGQIVGINHSVVSVSGLPGLKLEEKVITEGKKKGIVNELGEKTANVLIFNTEKLRVGERVARTNEPFKIPISKGLLGRVVNPLCQPIDGLGPIIGEKEYLNIKREAPGITERKRVKKPLETGVMVVDLLIPIGYGQRELIIGDAKTGKTTFLLQTIVNQIKKEKIVIYVGIGKETEAVKIVENYLKEMEVFDKTIMVISTAENPSTVNYLAPFSGMTIAEYFRDKGKDVLVVFDDLTSHAKFYREISLITKTSPGRSSYPGDIFHVQAALLERAGNIKKEGKEVSITALPVAQTLENDISGFIQTNLMAMTDGHIFFDVNDFRKGKRPAINAFLSVSRVGNQTKKPLDREIAGWIKRKLVEYQRTLAFSQFGVELSPKTQKLLDLGEKLEILFEQDPKTILPHFLQLLLFGLLLSGFWENKPKNLMAVEIEEILKSDKKGELLEIERGIKKINNLEKLKKYVKYNYQQIR